MIGKVTLLTTALLSVFCSAQSLIDHGYHSHHQMTKGKCPKLNDTMSHRNKTFDPKKMYGTWKTVYESMDRLKGLDCVSIKFQDFEGANSSQVRVLSGHQLHDPEHDISRFEDMEYDGVFFDDAYITFADKNTTGLGALYKNSEEINMDPIELIKKEMEPLSKEQMRKMNYDEIRLYSEHAMLLMKLEDEDLEQLVDPYKTSWQILETDYDQYFISYMCQEKEEMINSADQTEDEVWQLKQEKPNQSYDENYKKQSYHFLFAGIHVRNMSTLHQAQLRQYMLRLELMVPGHDFYESGHDMVVHGYKCPDPSEDLFTQPFIHSYQQMLDNIDEDGKVYFHQTYELVRHPNNKTDQNNSENKTDL